MRKILLLAIILMLIFTGCSKANSEVPKESEKAAPTNSVSYTAQISELKAPNYFIPQNITPNGLLFGQAGDKLISLAPQTGQSATLVESAWSGSISPDGKKLVYTNGDGLAVKILDKAETIKIAVAQNPMSSSVLIGTWSPDSNQFIYMLPYEWSSEYYIYDLEQGTSHLFEFKNVANFLSLPVNWSNDQIAFIVSANKSKSGEQEYREAGYRSDLYLADTSGNFKQLTDMDDNCFVEFKGITKDNKKIILGVYDKQSNQKRAGILSPSDGKINYLPTSDKNIATAAISPDGNFAVTAAPDSSGQCLVELYDLNTSNRFFSQSLSGSEPPQYFVWSSTPDKTQLFFGQSSNSANSKLYSITIGGQA